jgi:superfamily II DNA or RNA helicase
MEFFRSYPAGVAIILVPTMALLDQWFLSLQEELGVKKEEIGLLGGGEKPSENALIIVAVINSARRVMGAWSRPDRPKMLVVDECHRAGSPENAKSLIGEYVATLGLSATPVREYDEGFSEFVEPALGRVIYEYGYTDAFRDAVITPFSLRNVQVPLLPDEQDSYDKLTRRLAQISRGADRDEDKVKNLLQRRAAVSATATYRVPVAVKLLGEHRGERAIVFHERTDAADLIVKRLDEMSHSATLYHAGLSPALRRENLRLFRKGAYDVLVCCRALDEGMNAPETSIGIMASSSASHRQRIQRLGRILRPAEGKSHATVYTLYATREEEGRLEAEEAALEGVASTSWHRTRVGAK